MASRIANQIIVAAVKGGNTPGSVGSTAGGGTRGLFGIIPDAEAVSGFGVNVATEVDGLSGEDPYAAVIRTIDQIAVTAVSYTHLRAHETVLDLVCRLLLEKKTHHTRHTI